MIEVVRKSQLENSHLPKRYILGTELIPATPNDKIAFDRLFNIKDKVEKFVNEGHNLVIYSRKCGNGKTSWACKIALNYIDSYSSNYAITAPVIFVNAAEYINRKKAMISDRSIVDEMNQLDHDLYNADLVVWDDIATKALSEYDMEQLYVFINNRIANMKSNIFTSNCSYSDMPKIMGDRLGSRIVNNSITIELDGNDNRTDEF